MLHVAVLRGPSVIAFAKMMEDSPEIGGKRLSVDIVDSPELMQALLIKGKADLAALPMINAANLYNKGLKYSLLGCPVWGKSVSCRKARDTESITGNRNFICLRCRYNSRYPDPLLFTSKRIILFFELFVYYSR